VTKQNALYGYSLSVPFFNGAAAINANAQGANISFKQGKTRQHLELMLRLTQVGLGVVKAQEVKRSVISFNAHASFDEPADYAEHMKRYHGYSEDVLSGGLVLLIKIAAVDGQLRYASENSLVYPNALFFAANAVCAKDVNLELFKMLGEKFEAVAGLEGLAFTKISTQ
jgi:hypothetical protein